MEGSCWILLFSKSTRIYGMMGLRRSGRSCYTSLSGATKYCTPWVHLSKWSSWFLLIIISIIIVGIWSRSKCKCVGRTKRIHWFLDGLYKKNHIAMSFRQCGSSI